MTDNATAANAAGAPAPVPETEIPVQESHPEPLVVATDTPAATEPETTDETTREPEAAASPDAQTKAPQKLPDWAQKKLAESEFQRREAQRKAKELEDRLAAVEAAKAPPQAAPTPNAADEAAAERNAPTGGYRSQADFDRAVQAEASRRENEARQAAATAEFNRRSNDTFEAGVRSFGEDNFRAAVANLQSVGIMDNEFVSLALETDDPAKVLFELGSDPDRAYQLMALTPAKRAMELAKISAPAPKTPTKLSNAPRPVQPVEGSARVTGEPRDEDDDQTWFAKRNAEIRSRYSAA